MCQEALINYLDTQLNNHNDENKKNIPKKDIEEFIRRGDIYIDYAIRNQAKREKKENVSGIYKQRELPLSIIQHAQKIDDLLHNIKICDPAIGSGAFPVGIMNEIVRARYALSAYLTPNPEKNSYNFKRQCIQDCIYGVDIDPGAVEIAKLRLWLSLVVDEDDFSSIQPLPNLDYKIICADSLLGIDTENLFADTALKKIEALKLKYFNTTNRYEKQKLHNEIDDILFELTDKKNCFDFKIHFSEVFHNSAGFDIVIGNPPYVQLQKDHGKLANLYKNCNFSTFERTGDIYALFYEKGISILKPNGYLCFITSNKWMRAGYGKSLRKFFLNKNPILIIDLGPDIFENATVDTNILVIQNKSNENTLKAISLNVEAKNKNIADLVNQKAIPLPLLTENSWFIGSSAEQKLKEKIERIGKPLKEWDVNIYRGILTGLNEAFIITSEKRNEILNNCKTTDEKQRTEKIIKPILRGKDIKRYYYDWAGLWVIGTFPALHLDIEDYPAIKKYFLDNFDIRQLEQTGKKYPGLGFDARKKTGNKWFETQDQIAYYHEFEKEKLVWTDISTEPQFSILPPNYLFNNTVYMIISDKSAFLCGLLNSKFIKWFFPKIATDIGKQGQRYFKIFVEKIPLPPITSSNLSLVNRIECLVDRILELKRGDVNADTSDLEREIDELVYCLYDLSPEERAIIEAG